MLRKQLGPKVLTPPTSVSRVGVEVKLLIQKELFVRVPMMLEAKEFMKNSI